MACVGNVRPIGRLWRAGSLTPVHGTRHTQPGFSTPPGYFKCSPLSSNHPDLTTSSLIFKKALPLTAQSKEKPLRWELQQFLIAELRSLWYLSLLSKVNSVHLLHSALGTRRSCLFSRTMHNSVSPFSLLPAFITILSFSTGSFY